MLDPGLAYCGDFGGGIMSRRQLALAAFTSVMVASPQLAGGEQSEALRRLRTNIHHDMSTCIAFFQVVSGCLAKSPQHAKIVGAYTRTVDDLLYKSILVGKQLGISEDDAKSRLGAATDGMLELINKDCANVAALLDKYLDKCTAVASDPLNPLKNAAPKP